MDAAPFVRMRWRLRGAWLWPSFVVLSVADAVIIHSLPPSGSSQSLAGGWVLGAVLSLLGIALLAGAVGGLVRRIRPDMPRVVARNYAGALVTLLITLAFLAAGLVNQQAIASARHALEDAVARATAYIGDHAPVRFQEHLGLLDTRAVQAPVIYRSCASDGAGEHYCVVVNRNQPFASSVHYSGSEPNGLLFEGTS